MRIYARMIKENKSPKLSLANRNENRKEIQHQILSFLYLFLYIISAQLNDENKKLIQFPQILCASWMEFEGVVLASLL